MKVLLNLFLLTFFYTNVTYSQVDSYHSFMIKINNLESKGLFEDALSLLKQDLPTYPEKWFELSKELIYLNEKTNRFEENLAVFKEAHDKGYFYFIHPRMGEYKPYLEFPTFDRISSNDLKLMNEANQKSTSIYELKLPDHFDPNQKYPVLFIFHGGGKNIEDAKKHWTGKEIRADYIRVYLQSYRHFNSKTYGWGTSDKRLDKEITHIYDEIFCRFNIDESNIFTCGISAGASAAIDLSLRNIIPAKAVLAVCTGVPSFLTKQEFHLVKNPELYVYIVAGENDHFLGRQKQMTQLFEKLNIAYKHEIVKGMGHQYPENEEKYFKNFMNNFKL